MSRPWPVSLAMRESLANARAARWMATLLTVAVAWVSAAAGTAAALDTSRLHDAEQAWIEAGGYAYVVEPGGGSEGPGLSVRACERLNDVRGVEGAFAASVTTRTLEPSTAPGTSATLIEVSTGIYRLLGLTPPASEGVVTTQATTNQTGLLDGEHATFTVTDFSTRDTTGTIPAVLSVTDSPLLGETLAGAYLLPTLTDGDATQCYVTSDATHAETIETYLSTALTTADGSAPIVRPRLSDNTYGLDFSTAYGASLMRWAWAVGALAVFALWAVVRWTRRTQIAVYATFGADARARLVMQVTEWAALSGMGALWGWATGLALSLGFGADVHIALTQVTLQVAALWCAATLGVVALGLAPVGTLLDALKDRS